MKRVVSLFLVVTMLVGMLPITAWAADCEHHQTHDDACGYQAAIEGEDCTHQHTADCYKKEVCVHIHDEECGETCSHLCSVENGCITMQQECAHLEHDSECGGLDEENPVCNHTCEVVVDSEDSCYALLCSHAEADVHDDTCGYVEAEAEKACNFVCEACAKEEADTAAVAEVKALIDTIPAVDAVKELDQEGQLAAYNQTQAAYEAYGKLVAEQQAQLTGAEEVFSTLFAYFNTQTVVLPDEPLDNITVDETNFPDANFRSYILSQSYGKDGVLTREEIAEVTRISSWNMEIQDLTGIEHFTALTWLECNHNQLTKLDVSNNTELMRLNCGNNQLTELDVSKNIKLTELICGDNLLTKLDTSSNVALESLECSQNSLTELDLRNNTMMTQLNCSNNQLNELDVSCNAALTSLTCHNNQLSQLDVSRNTALVSLLCMDNQLTALDVGNNTALTELWCVNNQLTTLNLSKNIALTTLFCNNNQLTALNINYNAALSELNCFYNQLTELNVSSNIALAELRCYNNQLTTLDLSSNTALKYLDTTENQLTSLDVSQSTALTELYCGSNHLTYLNLSNNPQCAVVNAAYNSQEISLNEQDEFDLSTLSGFDVSKASNWNGGTVNGNTLMATAKTITYTYQIRDSISETFTLIATNYPETGEKCGDNVFWNFDEATGILTISGTGAMWDQEVEKTPWEAYITQIKSIVIEDGVQRIGSYAFSGCSSLTEIAFPGDAPSFGDLCFNGVKATAYYPSNNTTWTSDVRQNYGGDITWVPYGDTATSGTCGENLTWEFDAGTKTLTISGRGNMYDFPDAGSPWYSLNAKIDHVEISNGVTSIGNYAFVSCGMDDIEIPDSVTRIGQGAFALSSIESIKIPSGITTIEEYTFSRSSLNCVVLPEQLKVIEENAFAETPLTTVALPATLTEIGTEAFWGTMLTSVAIPENVSVIGAGSFAWCEDLTSISVAATNANFVAKNGILFDKDGTTLIQYPAKKDQATYVVPTGTSVIRAYAFSGAKALKKVELPDDMNALEECAFIGCSGLTEMIIPANVSSFGLGLFDNCHNLKTITFTGDAPDFAEHWISKDMDLTAYHPADNKVWTEDKLKDYGGMIIWAVFCDHSFGEWYETKAPTQGKRGEERRNCINCEYFEVREKDKIPVSGNMDSGNTSSGKCGDNLTWILHEDGNLHISGTGDMYDYLNSSDSPWYHQSKIKKVTMDEGVTSIGRFAFSYCKNLTTVNIPDSVTFIGMEAFDSCSSLTSIVIPEGVSYLNYGTFWDCYNLTNIDLPSNLEYIGECAFFSCEKLPNILIPDTVKGIGGSAFAYCESMTSINIPANVTNIGTVVFEGCKNLKQINIDPENLNYISIDGVLFDKNINTLIRYPQNKSDTFYIVPNTVTRIENASFHYCINLNRIVLPTGLQQIGDSAFSHCESLVSINIPKSVQLIDDWAFSGCQNIVDFELLAKTTEISPYVFYDCKELKNIFIPASVNQIRYQAFSNCGKLKNIYYAGSESDWQAVHVADGNFLLEGATFHYNSNGLKKENSGSIRSFVKWDMNNLIAYFDSDPDTNFLNFGSQVTDETDKSFMTNVDDLVGTYVLVETKARADGMIGPDILLSIKTVDTKIGTVASADESTIVINGETYTTPAHLMFPDSYVGKTVRYYLYNRELISLEVSQSNDKAYDVVLNEYRNGCSMTRDEFDNQYNEKDYPYVNSDVMRDYLTYGSKTFVYTYHDVDKNGTNELLLGYGSEESIDIIGLYAYDGDKAVKLMLATGEKILLDIFEDGLIRQKRFESWNSTITEYYRLDTSGYKLTEVSAGSPTELQNFEWVLLDASETTDKTTVAVRYYSVWDKGNVTAQFGPNDQYGSKVVTDETDFSFQINPTALLGQYVLVETKPRTDGQSGPDTLISMRAVETKAGTVSAANADSITIGEETYATPADLGSSENYVDQFVVYHLYDGKMVGIEILEEMEGILTYWNKEANAINIKLNADDENVILYHLSSLGDENLLLEIYNSSSHSETVRYFADSNNLVYHIEQILPQFEICKDNFSFINQASDFFTAEELVLWNEEYNGGTQQSSYVSFLKDSGLKANYQITDSAFARLISGMDENVITALREGRARVWSGSCFGMSLAMAIRSFAPELLPVDCLNIGSSDNLDTYQIPRPSENWKIEDVINYYQLIYNYPYFINRELLLSQIVQSDYQKALDLFIDFIENDEIPTVVAIAAVENGSIRSAHAVIALDIIGEDQESYTLKVYDPNRQEFSEMYVYKSVQGSFVDNNVTYQTLRTRYVSASTAGSEAKIYNCLYNYAGAKEALDLRNYFMGNSGSPLLGGTAYLTPFISVEGNTNISMYSSSASFSYQNAHFEESNNVFGPYLNPGDGKNLNNPTYRFLLNVDDIDETYKLSLQTAETACNATLSLPSWSIAVSGTADLHMEVNTLQQAITLTSDKPSNMSMLITWNNSENMLGSRFAVDVTESTSITMMPTDNGIVLSGDNLKNVEIAVENKNFVQNLKYNGRENTITILEEEQNIVVKEHEHFFDKNWYFDNNHHWNVCLSCGQEFNVSNHVGGSATCIKKAVCSTCGISYGDFAKHEYETTWSQGSSSGHWHECKNCSAHDTPVAHTPGSAATATKAQTCTVCGYVITPALGHTCTAGSTWYSNGTYHWHLCATCGAWVKTSYHSYSSDTDETCNVCSYTRTVAATEPTEETEPTVSETTEDSVPAEEAIAVETDQTTVVAEDSAIDVGDNSPEDSDSRGISGTLITVFVIVALGSLAALALLLVYRKRHENK